ncbi:hypothetical protein BCT15_05805 [Vibrio splendidus]|uniref:hypothetical protein n=1 Tax=Vibrio splendidus TaxID=29497 RepID=UPI000C8204AD|nr:hypothetical protein [Vibrio splendidus]PMO24534.1 hypothetical protein BCT15_05805 [Vibrio splendidus]
MSVNSKLSITLFLAKCAYLFVHIGVGLVYIYIFFDLAQTAYPELKNDILTTVSFASITAIWCSWGWDVKNSLKSTTTSYEFLCLKVSGLFECYTLLLLFIFPLVVSITTDMSFSDTFNFAITDSFAIGLSLCIFSFRPFMRDMFAHPHELASR